jgi:hypothetical protein|tara:strand:+ start:1238 stop:1822 length:585 start_codon:yes stop_codon:yes gene_type:complete
MAKRGRPKKIKSIPPTPETLAKLEPDVVQLLMLNNQISQEQESACLILREIGTALNRQTRPFLGDLIPSETSSKGSKAKDPFDNLSDYQMWLYSEVIIPWHRLSDIMDGDTVSKNTTPKTILEYGWLFVNMVVINNETLEACGSLISVKTPKHFPTLEPQQFVLKCLQNSLDLFNGLFEQAMDEKVHDENITFH